MSMNAPGGALRACYVCNYAMYPDLIGAKGQGSGQGGPQLACHFTDYATDGRLKPAGPDKKTPEQ